MTAGNGLAFNPKPAPSAASLGLKRRSHRRKSQPDERKGSIMPKMIFVIGANATGKTHFIRQCFSGNGMTCFNIKDYQQRVYQEEKAGSLIPPGAQFRYLMRANQLLLEDILKALAQGRDVAAEHTLYMAKRRIAYIDALRKAVTDLTISVYVMCPSDAQWEANASRRGEADQLQRYRKEAELIEFPNVSEGIDAIYEVVDGDVRLRMDPPRPEIYKAAKQALAEEAARLQREDEARERRKQLIGSMRERPFWHYCEVCGKSQFMTAQEAYDAGWDYPPHMGDFGLLGPRTCGGCRLTDTLYWKILTSGTLPIVREKDLTPEELVTWRRIRGEPESLLTEEA